MSILIKLSNHLALILPGMAVLLFGPLSALTNLWYFQVRAIHQSRYDLNYESAGVIGELMCVMHRLLEIVGWLR
jgi:hypothetical protein